VAKTTPSNAFRSWFTKDIGYKGISFAIALALWSRVQNDQVHQETVWADVNWQLPSNRVPLEPLPPRVQVRLKGSLAATRRARTGLVVPVDLTGNDALQIDLDLAGFEVDGLPQGVSVSSITPSIMRLAMDERGERKIPVNARIVGRPARGFEVEEVQIQPSVVTLSGPRSALRSLERVSTFGVDVSGVTEDVDVPLELDLPRTVTWQDAKVGTVHIDVENVLQRQTFSFPVVASGGWTSDPPTVAVVLEGPQSVLAELPVGSMYVVAEIPPNITGSEVQALRGKDAGPRFRLLFPEDERIDVVEAPAELRLIR